MRKGNLEKSVNSTSKIVMDRKSNYSLKWLYRQLSSNSAQSNKDLKEMMQKVRGGGPYVGGMVTYLYDPKTKEDLPYYDIMPLVIPIGLYSDGWLGLNMHYLPNILRARLLDKLMDYETKRANKRDYMKVSYSLLNSLSRHDYFKFALKRYLRSHVKSKILQVNSEYWETVAFLPSTKTWVGATQGEVWRDAKAWQGKTKGK